MYSPTVTESVLRNSEEIAAQTYQGIQANIDKERNYISKPKLQMMM